MTAVDASCELCTLLAGGDASIVWRNGQLAVLLVDDAAYPGFCRVVWQAHVKEMSDLAPAERNAVMEAVWRVEAALREVMAPEKVNLASLGNMTPHIHWHVMPRYADDAQFPAPIWANAQRVTPKSILSARTDLLPQLRAALVRRLDA
ncbi:MAG TPA: HIT family protein [Janthinobacterium sp.]|jgi:diadenosine tetraphosphate (Ap4A) HIT family hydrolase|nr:HIT family protein [Janthinobacterium sp.]